MFKYTVANPLSSLEPELDLMEREHETECAIMAGLVRFYGPSPDLPQITPKPLRKRQRVRFNAPRWPNVDLD